MGADIVIAVDLQHDAHLMQQDLFSLETPISGGSPAIRLRLRRFSSTWIDVVMISIAVGVTAVRRELIRVKRARRRVCQLKQILTGDSENSVPLLNYRQPGEIS